MTAWADLSAEEKAEALQRAQEQPPLPPPTPAPKIHQAFGVYAGADKAEHKRIKDSLNTKAKRLGYKNLSQLIVAIANGEVLLSRPNK